MNEAAAHFLFIVGTLSTVLIAVLIIRAILPKFFNWFRKTAFPVPKVLASTVSLVFLAVFVISKEFSPGSFYSLLQSPYVILYSTSSAATLNALTNAISPAQYRAQFALTSVTNVMHDFTAPTNAVFCDLGPGVHDEAFWIPLSFNPEGAATYSRWGRAVCVAPSGMVLLDDVPDRLAPSLPDLSGAVTNRILSVLQTPAGLLPPNAGLWHAPTTNGSFLITWQKVFLGRDTNAVADLQLELFQSGDFIYRLHLDENADASSVTNWLIAAQDNGGGEVFAFAEDIPLPQLESDPFSLVAATTLIPSGISLSPQTLELRWTSFGNLDPNLSDNDGDSLRDWDELYIHHTDPGNADTDADGLIDSFELSSGCDPLDPDSDNDGIADGIDPQPLVWNDADDDSDGDGLDLVFELLHGLNPATNDGIDSDGDGWADWKEILAGTNPNASYSTPLNDDGSCKIFDVTVTLNTPISRYVVVKVGDRSMMLTPPSPTCTLTLRQGIAHDVSLFSANPCTISLSASVASPYAAFQKRHEVFLVNGYLPGKWAVASGMIAQPVPDIEPELICFHDRNAKHVEALISPEMPGSYLWWSDGSAYGGTGKFIDLPYAGNDTVVEIAFTAEGATSARIFNREVFHCSLLEESSGGQNYEGPAGGVIEAGTGEPWFETYAGDGRLVTVNNDDDDASRTTDSADTEMSVTDNDLFGYDPIGHFTGHCCPCPEHQVKYADSATLLSSSFRLSLYTDAGKTNAFTGTIHAGEKLYVEGLTESPSVGAEEIVWQYTCGGQTHQLTNTFTVLSQRIFGDLDNDDDIDANDNSAQASFKPAYGWVMPPIPSLARKMLLRTDVDIPGVHVLSLSGNDAFRIYTSDATNGPPLLVSGQSITNGVNSVSFLSGTETTIYVEAFTNGVSTLTYSFIGTGSSAGIVCRASLKMTAFSVNVINIYEMLNVCNRVPNPKQNTSKRLFIATEPTDDLAKFRVAGSTYPPGLSDQIKVGLFDGSTCVETGYLQSDGEWAFYTVPSANVVTCQLKFGVDGNGDGMLQDTECGGDTGFSVTAFNSEEYDAQCDALNNNANLARTPYPVGATLLLMFLDQFSSLPDPPESVAAIDPVNCFTLGSLTHNAGETFAENGSGVLSRHLWNEGTKAATRVASSLELRTLVNSLLASYTNNVTSFFADHPLETTCDLSFTRGNQIVNFAETDYIMHPVAYDLHIAFGHAIVENLSVSCVFEKLSGMPITVKSLSLQGTLADLYDFNFEDGGLSQQGATAQLGWRTGSTWRNAGQIFGERVTFQAESTNWNYP